MAKIASWLRVTRWPNTMRDKVRLRSLQQAARTEDSHFTIECLDARIKAPYFTKPVRVAVWAAGEASVWLRLECRWRTSR